MRKNPLIWLIAAACLSGCTAQEKPGHTPEVIFSEGEELCLPLSLSVGTVGPQTKMTSAVTQADATEASFRGIKEIYAIPFRATRAVNGSDQRIGPNLTLPQQGIPNTFGETAQEGDFAGLVRSNNSHLYKNVYMRRGTASMLVYGQAIDAPVSVSPDSIAFKRRNGVLRKHGVESAETPADISFSLEPFITSAQEPEMQSTVNGLLTYLNSIAGTTVSQTGYEYRGAQRTWTYYWSTPSSYDNYGTLSSAFTSFTYSGRGFCGSSEALSQLLTAIYNSLYTIASNTSASSSYSQTWYTSSSRYADDYEYYYVYELANEIRTRIENSTYVDVTGYGSSATVSLKGDYANFPDCFGLPSGSVGIIWNGTAFVQQTSATGSGLAPIDAYCYPPSLWYSANSTLKTSDNEDIVDEYKSANTTWNDIFSQYTYSSSVIQGALSVALKDPLQYGVGMLEINLNKASPELLPDSNGDYVDVRNSNFPLTGIIIGEQKNQSYAFEPLLEGLSLYVFDNEVYDGSTPKAYIAGASSGLAFKPVHTLLVQTEDAQDVHVALEFQNNSGSDFYGANSCRVAAGSKFYLIATLEYTSGTGASLPAVFVHDHVTKVTFSINSLSKAYNTIPELRDPQLEIGVIAQMEWVQATPAEIPMY